MPTFIEFEKGHHAAGWAWMQATFIRAWIFKRLIKPNLNRIMEHFKTQKPIPEALKYYVQLMVDNNQRDASKFYDGPFQELKKINVPFVVVQNMACVSLHQFGAYDLFENAGTADNKKWLIISKAEYELPVLSWQLEALAFFDFVLKNCTNGYDQQAPVRYWLEGKNRFYSANNFPIPESKPMRFYLNTEVLQKEIPEFNEESWISIPAGARILPGIEQIEKQKLQYIFPVMHELILVGPVTLQLQFSCNEIDSYVMARLSRCDSQGKYPQISMGHLRPASRAIDEQNSTACEIAINTSKHQPLNSNQKVLLRFSLTPSNCALFPGEKLILEICSRSDLIPAQFSEGYIVPKMVTPPYFCRNWIHFGEDSFLEMRFLASPSNHS